MGSPYVFHSTTRSRVISTAPTRFGGMVVGNTGANGVSVCILNSGTSKNFAGISGSSQVVPFLVVKPSDSPWNWPAPLKGVRMTEGMFVYFGGVAGATCTVYYGG